MLQYYTLVSYSSSKNCYNVIYNQMRPKCAINRFIRDAITTTNN